LKYWLNYHGSNKLVIKSKMHVKKNNIYHVFYFFLKKRYDFSIYFLRELAVYNTQEDIYIFNLYVFFVRLYLAKETFFFLEVKTTQNKP